MGWLYEAVSRHFSGDDHVSWVHIKYARPTAVSSAYRWLRDKATGLMNESAYVWSKTEEREVPVDSIPNAAELVIRGEGEPFHVWLTGIAMADGDLPELGFFVFPDEIEVGWHGGSAWRKQEVEGFFALLFELTQKDPKATLAMPDGVVDDYVESFMEAWQRFLRERAA